MAKGPTIQIDLDAIDEAVADAAAANQAQVAIETDIELDEETRAEVELLQKKVPRAVYHPADGSVTYRLRFPRQLTRGGKIELDASELTFREPDGNLAKIALSEQSLEKKLHRMFAALTGFSPLHASLLMGKLNDRDIGAITNIISFFGGTLSDEKTTG